MSESLRNVRRIADEPSHAETEQGQKRNLSIELLPDGFVFSVMDADRFRYIALEDHRWDAFPGSDIYTNTIKQFGVDHPLFQGPFERVEVSYYTPHLVLLPSGAYVPHEKKAAYCFCSPLPPGHNVWSDRMNILNAYGIYAVPEAIHSLCQQIFPGHRLRHAGSTLIENLLASQRLDGWEADIALHIRKSHFELLLLNKGNLQFYQSFSYQAFDDLLYYLFFCLEQFDLEAGALHLMLLGEMALNSSDYPTLSNFFNRVSFLPRNDVFLYGRGFEQLPHHYYYNLLNLCACV